MKRPEMILFDYGQTLADEPSFDALKGIRALLEKADKNPHGCSPEQVRERENRINAELGRYVPGKDYALPLELPCAVFFRYVFASLGIELSISDLELDLTYWNAAQPVRATPGMADFLAYLAGTGIRTGVVSNISYCHAAMGQRIRSILPDHRFEFIVPSSRYMFRKPNPHLFEIALEKAGLDANDVWYYGDRFNRDVCGARAAGILPVWYLGAAKEPDPEHIGDPDILKVRTWDELKAYIESLA